MCVAFLQNSREPMRHCDIALVPSSVLEEHQEIVSWAAGRAAVHVARRCDWGDTSRRIDPLALGSDSCSMPPSRVSNKTKMRAAQSQAKPRCSSTGLCSLRRPAPCARSSQGRQRTRQGAMMRFGAAGGTSILSKRAWVFVASAVCCCFLQRDCLNKPVTVGHQPGQ